MIGFCLDLLVLFCVVVCWCFFGFFPGLVVGLDAFGVCFVLFGWFPADLLVAVYFLLVCVAVWCLFAVC